MKKEIKEQAKKIQKEIDSNGWTIDAHSRILALLHLIKESK